MENITHGCNPFMGRAFLCNDKSTIEDSWYSEFNFSWLQSVDLKVGEEELSKQTLPDNDHVLLSLDLFERRKDEILKLSNLLGFTYSTHVQLQPCKDKSLDSVQAQVLLHLVNIDSCLFRSLLSQLNIPEWADTVFKSVKLSQPLFPGFRDAIEEYSPHTAVVIPHVDELPYEQIKSSKSLMFIGSLKQVQHASKLFDCLYDNLHSIIVLKSWLPDLPEHLGLLESNKLSYDLQPFRSSHLWSEFKDSSARVLRVSISPNRGLSRENLLAVLNVPDLNHPDINMESYQFSSTAAMKLFDDSKSEEIRRNSNCVYIYRQEITREVEKHLVLMWGSSAQLECARELLHFFEQDELLAVNVTMKHYHHGQYMRNNHFSCSTLAKYHLVLDHDKVHDLHEDVNLSILQSNGNLTVVFKLSDMDNMVELMTSYAANRRLGKGGLINEDDRNLLMVFDIVLSRVRIHLAGENSLVNIFEEENLGKLVMSYLPHSHYGSNWPLVKMLVPCGLRLDISCLMSKHMLPLFQMPPVPESKTTESKKKLATLQLLVLKDQLDATRAELGLEVDLTDEGVISVTAELSNDLVGLVIGQKGTTIRALQEEHKCYLNVPKVHQANLNNRETAEHVLFVVGRETKILDVQRDLHAKLRFKRKPSLSFFIQTCLSDPTREGQLLQKPKAQIKHKSKHVKKSQNSKWVGPAPRHTNLSVPTPPRQRQRNARIAPRVKSVVSKNN